MLMHPVSDEGRMRRPGGASTPKPAIELTMNINFTLLAQALAFAGLIWIIATKIWPPLMNAIEERQQKIAEGLAAADRSQKDLAQAQEKVNEALKEARTKANEIIDQAHAVSYTHLTLPTILLV